MSALARLRARKILFALSHPGCWRALALGVAPSVEHLDVVAGLDFDRLIDVGANRGQFSLLVRTLFPRVPIQAFEPLASEARVFRRIHGRANHVELREMALGDESGVATMHLSGRADSSSLLPIGARQEELFPGTREIGTAGVRVESLDSLGRVWEPARRALLKIDVQGFELPVILGARRALRHCAYVYVECSHEVLYEGQGLYAAVEAALLSDGFCMKSRVNEQFDCGGLVQADYLFARSD